MNNLFCYTLIPFLSGIPIVAQGRPPNWPYRIKCSDRPNLRCYFLSIIERLVLPKFDSNPPKYEKIEKYTHRSLEKYYEKFA